MNAKAAREGKAKRFGEWILSHKLLVIILSFLTAFSLGSGGRFLTMSSDYRYFFGKENPQRLAFERMQNVYSKEDSVIFAITTDKGSIFNKETLNGLKGLTKKAWKIPFSSRVDSITNFQHTEAEEDDLIVRDLVPKNAKLNKEEIEKIKRVSFSEPLISGNLVSKNEIMTAINVKVNLPGKSPMEVPNLAKYVRNLAREFEKENPGHKVRLTGIAMLNNAFNEAGMKDMMTLTPLMYFIILLIMSILLRSIFPVLSTLGVIIFSVAGAMGAAGWLGIPITPPSSIAPTVIVTLAIADSVHLLKAILGFMARGWSKKEAILEGLRVNIQPVFLTSLTTVIGFLSLNFSDTPPFHDLGNITAIGVTLAFLFSITLLPVLTYISPLKVKIEDEMAYSDERNFLVTMGKWIVSKKKPIIFGAFFLTIFLGMQIPKIKLNDQFVEYFDKSIPFRVQSDFVMKNLNGIYVINYDLRSGESQGLAKVEFLKNVEGFSNYARSLDGVTHVNSITDTFKRLNKNMHGDNSDYYKLPASRELAAQYLLLYEMSLPYGLDLNNQIDVDKSGTRVVVTMGNLETAQILSLNDKLENWLIENTPQTMHAIGNSPTVMFSHISKRNVVSMGWGTLFAFSLITLCLIFALRSFKYGLISLFPNIIPAAFAFGIWSLTVGEAGFAIALVTSVTLGIVVDDTVHFLAKYVRARREHNLSPEEAVLESFKNVGSALIVTTIILVVGFSVLLFSSFKVNWTLGALSALTIAIALIVDFLLLPSILVVFDRKPKEILKSVGGFMKPKSLTLSISLFFLAIGLSEVVKGEEPIDLAKKGLEIATLVKQKDKGWVNQISNVHMILKNKQGQESKRIMKIKSLEVEGDGDKSLTIFKTPRDVKGTAFLSFSHTVGNDDQWLYLPALKRVKRISSHNKSGPFMGSEFAYEDISSQEVAKYTYKFIRDEEVDGSPGFVLEQYPTDENSGYTKQIVWIDSVKHKVHKVEFYDRKSEKLKTLTYVGFKKYPNGKWRPDKMVMINHQNGKSTSLVWNDYKFNAEISSRDFDKNALKRIK